MRKKCIFCEADIELVSIRDFVNFMESEEEENLVPAIRFECPECGAIFLFPTKQKGEMIIDSPPSEEKADLTILFENSHLMK